MSILSIFLPLSAKIRTVIKLHRYDINKICQPEYTYGLSGHGFIRVTESLTAQGESNLAIMQFVEDGVMLPAQAGKTESVKVP